MASGISKAKGRRSSKMKAKGGRAKAGLPAKAGRRRPHNIVKNAHGDYIAADFKPRPKEDKVEVKPYQMGDTKVTTISIPHGTTLRDGMMRIDAMERHSKANSDPFAFNRMRTHFKHGIFEFGKEHK
jgi:hypothetical protein